MYPQKHDTVRVLVPTHRDFDNDKIGVVTNRDGEYILVKLSISGVECEHYPCELEVIKKATPPEVESVVDLGYN